VYSVLALPLSAIICSLPSLLLGCSSLMLVWVKDEPNLRVYFFSSFLFFVNISFSLRLYLLLVTQIKYQNAPLHAELDVCFG